MSRQGTSHRPSILLGPGASAGSQGVRWHYGYGSVTAGGGRMGYRAAGLYSSLSCAGVTPFRNVGAGEGWCGSVRDSTKGLCKEVKLEPEHAVGGTRCARVVFAMAVCSVPQCGSSSALQGGEERGKVSLFSLRCVWDVVLPPGSK